MTILSSTRLGINRPKIRHEDLNPCRKIANEYTLQHLRIIILHYTHGLSITLVTFMRKACHSKTVHVYKMNRFGQSTGLPSGLVNSLKGKLTNVTKGRQEPDRLVHMFDQRISLQAWRQCAVRYNETHRIVSKMRLVFRSGLVLAILARRLTANILLI